MSIGVRLGVLAAVSKKLDFEGGIARSKDSGWIGLWKIAVSVQFVPVRFVMFRRFQNIPSFSEYFYFFGLNIWAFGIFGPLVGI